MPGSLFDSHFTEVKSLEIEEKFSRLSPEAQNAVTAFIDFLISRGGESEKAEIHDGEIWDENLDEDVQSVRDDVQPSSQKDQEMTNPSGIILAEERPIDESESIIDFADINTRFAPKNPESEKKGQVKQRKMFDWL